VNQPDDFVSHRLIVAVKLNILRGMMQLNLIHSHRSERVTSTPIFASRNPKTAGEPVNH